MSIPKKWLWKAQNKVFETQKKGKTSFERSFNYALQLFEKGDYLGAISYFSTAESNQKSSEFLELKEWKKKALECHELIREAQHAEKKAQILEENSELINKRQIRKLYSVAFFNYCKLKNLNPKHPNIRQKVWRMRFKSR